VCVQAVSGITSHSMCQSAVL